MGVIAELARVASSALAMLHGAPGRQVITTAKGLGGVATEVEVYPSPGVFSRPPKGARVVVIPLGGGKTRVAIGAVNYNITLDITDGETAIYSTNAAGDTLKAKIYLDALGNITLNGDSKRLVTWDALNTAMQALVGAVNTALGTKPDGAGTPGTLTLDLTSAKTTTIKTGG